jgi:hypothetical protein
MGDPSRAQEEAAWRGAASGTGSSGSAMFISTDESFDSKSVEEAMSRLRVLRHGKTQKDKSGSTNGRRFSSKEIGISSKP